MRTLVLLALLVGVALCGPWGRRGRFDRRKQLDKPNFFKSGPSKTVYQEYQKVVTTYDTVPDRDASKQFKGWYDKQPPDFKKDFKSYRDDCQQQIQTEQKKHQAAQGRFSPKAKEADNKILDICNNDAYSQQQKLDQIEQYQQTLPPEVQKELDGVGDSYYEVVVTLTFVIKIQV